MKVPSPVRRAWFWLWRILDGPVERYGRHVGFGVAVVVLATIAAMIGHRLSTNEDNLKRVICFVQYDLQNSADEEFTIAGDGASPATKQANLKAAIRHTRLANEIQGELHCPPNPRTPRP